MTCHALAVEMCRSVWRLVKLPNSGEEAPKEVFEWEACAFVTNYEFLAMRSGGCLTREANG